MCGKPAEGVARILRQLPKGGGMARELTSNVGKCFRLFSKPIIVLWHSTFRLFDPLILSHWVISQCKCACLYSAAHMQVCTHTLNTKCLYCISYSTLEESNGARNFWTPETRTHLLSSLSQGYNLSIGSLWHVAMTYDGQRKSTQRSVLGEGSLAQGFSTQDCQRYEFITVKKAAPSNLGCSPSS